VLASPSLFLLDQAPRVENAIAILSELGFYYLDFSTDQR
jgi:hypothetical protein